MLKVYKENLVSLVLFFPCLYKEFYRKSYNVESDNRDFPMDEFVTWAGLRPIIPSALLWIVLMKSYRELHILIETITISLKRHTELSGAPNYHTWSQSHQHFQYNNLTKAYS